MKITTLLLIGTTVLALTGINYGMPNTGAGTKVGDGYSGQSCIVGLDAITSTGDAWNGETCTGRGASRYAGGTAGNTGRGTSELGAGTVAGQCEGRADGIRGESGTGVGNGMTYLGNGTGKGAGRGTGETLGSGIGTQMGGQAIPQG